MTKGRRNPTGQRVITVSRFVLFARGKVDVHKGDGQAHLAQRDLNREDIRRDRRKIGVKDKIAHRARIPATLEAVPPLPRLLAGLLALLPACLREVPLLSRAIEIPRDVAVIPGCPSNGDGSMSHCQKRRAAWGSLLWQDGAVSAFIVSGADVHNPYRESEGLLLGLVALGVPRDRVFTETQALHTDENIAFSLDLVDSLGFHSVVVASEGLQAKGMCAMANRWAWDCVAAPLDERRIAAIVARIPELTAARQDGWVNQGEQDRARARAAGLAVRKGSVSLYSAMAKMGRSGVAPERPRAPVPEPSLLNPIGRTRLPTPDPPIAPAALPGP